MVVVVSQALLSEFFLQAEQILKRILREIWREFWPGFLFFCGADFGVNFGAFFFLRRGFFSELTEFLF